MTAPRATASLLALVAVTGTACGGDDPRSAVADYVDEANAVQKRYAPDFERANRLYAAQAKGKLTPESKIPELERARTSILGARDELQELDPPPQARRLHADLLRVMRLNAEVGDETIRLARYAKGAPEALEPLGRAGRTLQRDLRAGSSPERQARALDAYSGAMSKMLRLMGELDVPVVLRPTHRAQVRRLLATRRLARRLRRAAAEADARSLARLLLRFRELNGRGTPGQRELATKGIDAYNRLLERLDRAETSLVREQNRLNREVA